MNKSDFSKTVKKSKSKVKPESGSKPDQNFEQLRAEYLAHHPLSDARRNRTVLGMPISRYQTRWATKRRDEWLKANGPCRECGSSKRLEVDHIDPTQKVTHRVWSWSSGRRNAELAKCQVLCRSCHQNKTAAYNAATMKGRPAKPQKLTPEIVIKIYAEANQGGGPRSLGRKYGVNHSTIIGIRDGRYWTWLLKERGLIGRDAA